MWMLWEGSGCKFSLVQMLEAVVLQKCKVGAESYTSSLCTQTTSTRDGEGEQEVNEGKLDEVKYFYYCVAGVDSTVRGRVEAAWLKWKEVAGLHV